jgi:probable HAF family extracellular repeat protein
MQSLKFWMLWVTTMVLACFSNAVAQTSYTVTDLGILRDEWNLSCAMAVNNHGWALTQNGFLPNNSPSGVNPLPARDTINIGELKIDLGSLGGPNTNTWMNWGGINDRGQAVGISETLVPDPDGEDVCALGTGLTCLPFLWQDGQMSALPTLGGNNGQASDINNRGQIAGTAETTDIESTCPFISHISLPVIWEQGKPQPLPTLDHNPDGFVFAINDLGQAVGYSGTCTRALHAVLWQGGTAFPLPGIGRGAIAQGVNNQGQIVGLVGSPGTFYAALWQNATVDAVTNLGTLPGDFAALATGINSRGQVVGSTMDSSFNWSHAFIWQDGVMADLNTLFPASSNLFATMANKINERGQIVGMGTVLSGPHAGETHAFLATPVHASAGTSIADVAPTRPKSNLPANVNKQLLQRFGLGRFVQ